jgi:hypothetical protein
MTRTRQASSGKSTPSKRCGNTTNRPGRWDRRAVISASTSAPIRRAAPACTQSSAWARELVSTTALLLFERSEHKRPTASLDILGLIKATGRSIRSPAPRSPGGSITRDSASGWQSKSRMSDAPSLMLADMNNRWRVRVYVVLSSTAGTVKRHTHELLLGGYPFDALLPGNEFFRAPANITAMR